MAAPGKHVVTETTYLQLVEAHLAARAIEISAFPIHERPNSNTRDDANQNAELTHVRCLDHQNEGRTKTKQVSPDGRSLPPT
jgi:hypothetical protein